MSKWYLEQLKKMSEAKEQATEQCTKSESHDFKVISHSDSKDSYTWFLKCSHCDEIIKRTQKRTGSDSKLWG